MLVDERNDSFDESESLFGSPPPSPGRSRSPDLALPGASTENVGTIALPGPHICSELSMNPPDSLLSVNHPAACPVRLPPPPPPAPPEGPQQVVDQRSSSATPTPSTKPRKAREKGKQTERSCTSTPRPTPPPINMPEPGAPPPLNFLRNQQSLLGLAGLVGGVNPAHLKRSAGTSSKNPIIVEEGHDPPSLAQRSRLPFIDPSQCPTPSSQAILETMIKQKNIFPVLGSILKLISNAATPSTPSFYKPYQHLPHSHSPSPAPSSENDGPPPAKRKKVTKVPAGASNWDVPFPLDNGEVSQDYLANWERARTKQLVVQLVNLIRTAANKAATKEYVKKMQQSMAPPPPQLPNVMGHYRPATLFYGTELDGQDPAVAASFLQGAIGQGSTSSIVDMLTDVSNGNDALRPIVHDDAAVSPHPDSLSYDQLITAILTTDASLDSNAMTLDSLPEVPTSADNNAIDVEGWMSLLRSLPPADGDCVAKDTESSSAPEGSESPNNSVVADISDAATGNASTATSLPNSDFAIDPFLLALSQVSSSLVQAPGSSFGTESPQLPALSNSPIASTSSIAGPPTPPGWDTANIVEPGIYSSATADDPMAAATMLLRLASESTLQRPEPPHPLTQGVTSYEQMSAGGSQQQVETSFTSGSYEFIPPATPASLDPSAHGPSSNSSRRPNRQGVSSTKKISKEDILRRTKERRRQLLAEIERAKIQLWETTLEQGVLTHLIKDSG